MNITAITKNRWVGVLKRSFDDWVEDKALRLSAALAYYSIFSIAPLLVITIAVAGLVLGPEAVSGHLYGQLRGYVGAQSAEALQSMVQSASKPAHGVLAATAGFVTMMLGASGVFGQLKDALNTIWEVEPKSGSGIMGFLRGKLLNFGMVLVIGFLLLVSLVLSSAIAGLNHQLENLVPLPAVVGSILAFLISLGIVTALFAMIFKVLPDAKVAWKDVWVGAVITGLLFEVGKTGLSWYLGREGTASAYGAAGSVVLLLLWVYYTSCILFFGAEITQVYAQASGRVIEPAANAKRINSEARVQQGLGPGKRAAEEHPTPPQVRRGRASFLQGVMAPFVDYAEGRGKLLTLEARQALRQVIKLALWLAVAVVAIFAGWLLLATALVGWLVGFFGWSWVTATAVTGGIQILIVAAAGLVMRRCLANSQWFADTLNEFRKDRTWLKETTTKN